MLGAALLILKILGGAAAFALFTVLFSPFMLSSRISREEEAEEYRLLCQRLQKLVDQNAANDAAEHQESPVRLVGP